MLDAVLDCIFLDTRSTQNKTFISKLMSLAKHDLNAALGCTLQILGSCTKECAMQIWQNCRHVWKSSYALHRILLVYLGGQVSAAFANIHILQMHPKLS